MRHSFLNPSVVAIMEELQGSNSAAQQQGALPTPGKSQGVKPGTAAAKVAQGVQAVDNKATGAQQGVDQLHHDMANQQGVDPKQAAQVNANLKAQPRPTRPAATTQARAVQNDINANRNLAVKGKEIGVEEALDSAIDKAITEAEDEKPAGEEELTNPDDGGEDYNDQDDQTKKAKERAKALHDLAGGPKKTSTMKPATEEPGRGQRHNDLTSDKQKTAKGVFSETERNDILNGVFG